MQSIQDIQPIMAVVCFFLLPTLVLLSFTWTACFSGCLLLCLDSKTFTIPKGWWRSYGGSPFLLCSNWTCCPVAATSALTDWRVALVPAGWCLVEVSRGLRFLHTGHFLFPLWNGVGQLSASLCHTAWIFLWLWPSAGREYRHVELPTAPRIEVLYQHVQHFNITMNLWWEIS